MRSTMQDVPLTISRIREYASTTYGTSEVMTAADPAAREGGGTSRTQSFAETGERAARLANALRSLGIDGDQRVGTFMWNNAEHLEAYLAVPSMGAVLHTLNIRLYPEQLTYIANHAEDKAVIVDASLLEPFAKLLASFETVEHVLVAGPGSDTADLGALEGAGRRILRYEQTLAEASPEFDWPEIDERSAASMCYTSGTTGNPKGVVYSHRSTYLHAMAQCMGDSAGVAPGDRVLPVVPMFHANAWGLVYAALMVGATLTMPDRWLQAEPLARFIAESRPTIGGGVPTVWNDLVGYADRAETDLSSIRLLLAGGSAVPESLQRALWNRHRIPTLQAWGMTETSPVASAARAPVGAEGDDAWSYRATQGRLLCGVRGRLVGEDGAVVPNDGAAVGELEVQGPWVTGAYYRDDDPAKFHDGWLRTGDVGTVDSLGYVTLTDRAKDVIKSGGEWISSVDLENALMGHDDVVEAAVIGIPDEKWQERPLATVVLRDGASVTPTQLRDYLGERFARWQLPDRWAFIDAVPRTSVGKFDKKVLRRQFADGSLDTAAD